MIDNAALPLLLRDTRARVSAPGLPRFAIFDLRSVRDGVATYEGVGFPTDPEHVIVEIMLAGEVIATAHASPAWSPAGFLSVSVEVRL